MEVMDCCSCDRFDKNVDEVFADADELVEMLWNISIDVCPFEWNSPMDIDNQ